MYWIARSNSSQPRPVFNAAIGLLMVAALWVTPRSARAEPAATTLPAVRTPVRDPLTSLPSYGAMLRRTAYTLFAIVAGVLIAAKLLQRWLGASPRALSRGRLIQVVEYHRLEPRKGVYLLRVAGQYYLVGSTGDRLETLAGGALDSQAIADALAPAKPGVDSPDKPALAPPRLRFIEVLRGKRTDAGA